MTSQHDVAVAFFNRENTPSVASNFDLVTVDSETAFLVGDSEIVFAKREPFGSFTIYENRLSYGDMREMGRNFSDMSRRHIRRQQRVVRNAANNAVRDTNYNVVREGQTPKHRSEFPELQETMIE